MSQSQLPQRVRLSATGMTAELQRDTLTDTGVVLSIGGAEQSHVEVGDPGFLLHDYLRRMRSVITAVASTPPAVAPRTALHLGAGALTLPRWLAHRWPQIAQTVVDYEPELVDFVLEHLPMEPAPRNIVADAGSVLSDVGLSGASAALGDGALAGERFELIVVDLYNSAEAPAHLCTTEFFSTVLAALAPVGEGATPLMLLNFGDEADMTFARGLVRTVLDTAQTPQHALVAGPDGVLGAQEEGNLIMAVSEVPFNENQLGQIWAAGPHPGSVLSGEELAEWAGWEAPRRDFPM